MSGGVDSSVSVALLQEAGFEVVGVHFLMKDQDQNSKKAQEVAKILGIELIFKDIREDFQKKVIDDFVNGYANDLTPNPCVVCNPSVKFKHLLELADELEIEKVATGHYVRVVDGDLFRGIDSTKDQSYFLYRLNQEQLGRIVFPLGDKHKKDIKKKAEELGLPEFEGESQGVCFFASKKDLKKFLMDSLKVHPGEIISEETGEKLGEHQGVEFYTLGQRHGLDLSGGPFYVVKKDVKSNKIFVAKNKEHPALWQKETTIKDVHWIGEAVEVGREYGFKVRYPSEIVSGKMVGESSVEFDKSQWAIAPGQSVVVYDGEKVLGGGIVR